MSKEEINPLDGLFPVIVAAVNKWKEENTAEKITSEVTKRLNKSRDEITLKLLGFKTDWGNWELDHCNGRSGNSAAGDFLRKVQQDAIQQWLTENLMPELTSANKTRLIKEMNSEYHSIFRSAVMKHVREKADRDAQQLMSEITKDNLSANYAKLARMINTEED